MTWTTDVPKEPGRYWLKNSNGNVSIVEVRQLDGEVQWRTAIGWFTPLTPGRIHAHWAGPIPEPEGA